MGGIELGDGAYAEQGSGLVPRREKGDVVGAQPLYVERVTRLGRGLRAHVGEVLLEQPRDVRGGGVFNSNAHGPVWHGE